jgi:Protein of unknown function (DUF2281)
MTEELILAELKHLPDSLKTEVLHFAAFLKKEYAAKPATTRTTQRIFGRTAGKYALTTDFDAPLSDFTDYM